MDHQVGDHIDVGGARNERAHAVRLDEARLFDAFRQRHDTGVETFQVANLQHNPGLLSSGDNRRAFFDGRSDGFFQQHMHALLEKQARDRQVKRGGHHDTDGIDLAEQLRRVGERIASGFFGNGVRRVAVDIHDADQVDFSLFGIDQGMEPAEIADSYNPHTQTFRQSTVLRQLGAAEPNTAV